MALTRSGLGGVAASAWKQAQQNDVGMYAASTAYFGLFALFPTLATIVAAYGVFGDPTIVQQHVHALSRFAPADAVRLAEDQLNTLVSANTGALAVSALVSLALAVWGASRGTDAFVRALNRVAGEGRERSFVKGVLVSLTLTAAAALTAVVLVVLLAAVPIVLAFVRLGPAGEIALGLASFAVALAAVVAYAAVLYRWGPVHTRLPWKSIFSGAAAAAVLWAIASAALGVYVERFASMSETYGSIAGVVVLILWLYVSAFVFLLGGVLSTQLSKRDQSAK